MSALGSPTSSPSSPHNASPKEHPSTPLAEKTTRTVAIIKPHALNNRFDIEQRISEAGFEIVKERQMEFDIETDPDTLYDLFGDDYESFAEGPVWVYVLERRRAVEVWHTLMGAPDPDVARQDAPHSLRALYGVSLQQNAVMGSPDAPSAELQIQAIFASSPPFPTTDLPDVNGDFPSGSLHSVSSSVLSALRKTGSDPSSSASRSGEGNSTPNGKSFRARPLPATHVAPDIVPRMSRAAALRAGLPVDKVSNAPRSPPSKEKVAQTFQNVPGHKRTETIAVASTAPPVVAPRMTRAASLRLGQKPAEKPKRPTTSGGGSPEEKEKATFDGVPGHKRRESIAVASTRPPSVAPKSNRSASLRQQKEVAPPSSFMFRKPSQTPLRSSSRNSYNPPSATTISRPPSSASAVNLSTPSRPIPTSRASMSGPRPSLSGSRPSLPASRASISGGRPSIAGGITSSKEANGDAESPTKPRTRVNSAQAPTIAPRTNKSALLRAAKMATAAMTPSKAKPAAARPVRV
ncbi:hypothetical protein B0H21DRAFT_737890 [Amylocystis lapponica]|nr:hypothetical protein B0H21DRAFT_737890 [Amylocystis lapponica]